MAPTTRQIGSQALFFCVIVILFFAAPIAAGRGSGGPISSKAKMPTSEDKL
jgi:hypothetical protein